jgi:hypothetical protein
MTGTEERFRADPFDVRRTTFKGYTQLDIGAGQCRTERIVPPAGEAYAFEVPRWTRTVSVAISPTGRSVRVWIDGVEVTP